MSWPTVSLGKICQLRNGRAFKPEEWTTSGTPIVRIQNLNDDNKAFNYCLIDIESKFWVDNGDLLFSWSGTPGTSFGAFFWNRGRAYLNQHIFRVDVDDRAVEKSYLRYALNSLLDTIIGHSHGGVGLKHITKGRLEEVQIPLPPLNEQRRIAVTLDKAAALRAKRREAIAKLDQLLQSVFIEMFGNPITNPKGWAIRGLDELCRGITDIDHKMPIAVEDGLPFISAKDLTADGRISFENIKRISEADFRRLSRKSRPEKGDIIYSRIGVNLGKARIVDVEFPFLASYSCCTIKPNQELVDTTFLCSLLDSPFTLRQAHKGVRAIAVPDLGLGEIKAFKMILPPISLQRTFARRVAEVDKLKASQRASLSSLGTLFGTLQHRAFAGIL